MSHRFGATAYGLEPVSRAKDDWRACALCRFEDPEMFFPIGDSGPAVLQVEQAKAVCRRCSVADECLEWALGSGQEAGVWGGMSEEDRREEAKRRGVVKRRRHGGEYQAAKTHCPQRHPYTDENTYVSPNGKRRCRTCLDAQRNASPSATRKLGVCQGCAFQRLLAGGLCAVCVRLGKQPSGGGR